MLVGWHDLNRFVATDFLSEAWMQQLRLQPEDQIFGSGASKAETLQLPEAITREWHKAGAHELRLHCQGDPNNWDFAAPSLKRRLLRWCARDQGEVRLLLPSAALEQLTPEQQDALNQLCSWDRLTVHRHDNQFAGLLAEVVDDQGCCTAWGSRDSSMGVPDETWGQMGANVLVRARLQKVTALGEVVKFPSKPLAGLLLSVENELDGEVSGFGQKLLKLLNDNASGQLLEGDAAISTLTYHDRYLHSPLPVALLLDFIGAIKDMHQKRWGNPTIEIVTCDVPPPKNSYTSPFRVFHNWQSAEERDEAIQAAFEQRAMKVAIQSLEKEKAPHARTLVIGMSDGRKLTLWLDQGFGYWHCPRRESRTAHTRSTRFNFNDSPSHQGEKIAEGRYAIEGYPDLPTLIHLEKT